MNDVYAIVCVPIKEPASYHNSREAGVERNFHTGASIWAVAVRAKPKPVGWVELVSAFTRVLDALWAKPIDAAAETMGLALLDPSYGLRAGS